MWMVALAAVAFADVAPPPDYVESCTADRARPGEECVLCLRPAFDCPGRYEAAGFEEVCKAWGNVGERVMCRPQAGPAVALDHLMPSMRVDVASTDVPDADRLRSYGHMLRYCYESAFRGGDPPDATIDLTATIDHGHVVEAAPKGAPAVPEAAIACMVYKLERLPELAETSTGTADVRVVYEHVPDAQVLTTAPPAPTTSTPSAPSAPTSSWPVGALAAVLGTGLLSAAAIGVWRRR